MPVEKIDLLAGNHAIEVVNFAVVFRSPLDSSDEARLEEKIEDLRPHFAAIDKPELFQVIVGESAPTNQPRPVMYQLNDFSRDGKPEWSAQFGDNAVAVSCKKYSGWSTVWPGANDRLMALLACVDAFKPVASIEYSVTDTFSEQLPQDDSDLQLRPSNVFTKGSWVPDIFMDYHDPRWDFQAGKFSSESDEAERLERVDARSVLSGQRVLANLTHSLSYKFRSVPLLKDLMARTAGQHNLQEVFDNFHRLNKDVLGEILSEELTNKMGL